MKRASFRAAALAWLAVLFSPAMAQVNRPPLSANAVAQLAYDQGFRGGSLLAAVAVASAESSFDPDAICNNLHVHTAAGVPLFQPDGKPVLATVSSYDGSLLALGSWVPLNGGNQGKVIGHCRGLWQINSVQHPTVPLADCFSPEIAISRAWGISRKGRFWGKWTSVMTGAAWAPATLTPARAAARAIDPSVLPSPAPAGLRVEAWTTGGGVRATAGGTFLRGITKGDTGTVLSGPVVAAITEGIQTSRHLWYQVQWDHGTTGWVVEEYLTARVTPPLNALPAYDPTPAHNALRVPFAGTTLQWTIGGNTKQLSLRFGTDPALTAAGTLKLSGGRQTSWPTGPLAPYQNYYWRIDAEGGNGVVVQGPTWTFRSAPLPAPPVAISDIQVTPLPAQLGQLLTITGKLSSPTAQTVMIGASIFGHSDPARDIVFTIPGGNVPTSFTRTFQLTPAIGLGYNNLEIAVWQDVNNDGKILQGDVRIAHLPHALTVEVRDLTPPTLANLSVSPVNVAPNQPVQLSVTASDSGGSGLAGVYFYRAFGEAAPGGWQMVAYRPVTGNGPVLLMAQDTPFNEGRYWYEMEAVDQQGNRRRLQAAATVRVQIPDLAPPVAQWLSPQNGGTINGGVTVTGRATDDRAVATVHYRVNGGPWIQVFQNFNQWSFFLDPVFGSNVIEMRAVDTAGKSSGIERLYLYHQGNDFETGVFDEMIPFNGAIPARWQLQTNGSSFENGLHSGRLQAWFGEAWMTSMKTAPAWADAVEMRFTADPGATLTWRDNAARLWQIRYRQSPRSLEIGRDGALQQILLDNSFNRKIRSIWRDGAIEITAFTGQQVPAPQTISLPQLRLVNLSGDMEFRVQSTVATTTTLDDIQLRALRPEDRFAIVRHRLVPGGSSQVRWPSFSGRNYVVEISPTMATGSWTLADQSIATGLISERAFTLPAGPRRFVRVREGP